MGVLDRLLRVGEGKKLKALGSLVPDINAFEPEMQALTDDALRAKTAEFRDRLANGEDLDDLLIEAFAVVREGGSPGDRPAPLRRAAHGRRRPPLRVGRGDEDRRGQDPRVDAARRTSTASAAKGMHIITVNDYLARRDAEWMGQIHRWMGLDVGLIIPGDYDQEYKRREYGATSPMARTTSSASTTSATTWPRRWTARSSAGHVYAIVDEVDSILIDEARTPLIISGRVADAAKLYYRFASIVRGLQARRDYEVDEEKRTVAPTEDGIERVEQALGLDNLYDAVSQNLVHQLQAALKAKELYKRDKDYIISDGEVKIVDEFTGRILEGRRWSEGLHQAVEAKEGVKIKEENQTLATITLQNYFRMYEKLAGMTGTAQTEASELAGTYNLQVVPIPTNRTMVRIDQQDLIYKSEDGKFEAVVEDLVERWETGQPVLVGTVSVEKSEKLSRLLQKRGVAHEVLNAKQHTREALIVTQAGRLGAVTVATNMAGRGVDILLGGNPEGLAEREVAAEGLDPESEEGLAAYAAPRRALRIGMSRRG